MLVDHHYWKERSPHILTFAQAAEARMSLIACPECSRQVAEIAPACPGCGAPVAAMHQARLKEIADRRAEKNSARGCLVLGSVAAVVFLVVMVAAFRTDRSPTAAAGQTAAPSQAEREKAARAEEAAQARARAEIEANDAFLKEWEPKIREFRRQGFINKIDFQLNEVWVTPLYWHAMTYDAKSGFGSVMARYMKANGQMEHVTVKDNLSGKRLAKQDIWGFKVYD